LHHATRYTLHDHELFTASAAGRSTIRNQRCAVAYDALPIYLAQSRVFVRPSRSEGLGIAFLDAMAAGIPVVAPPVGGITDFLKDRETGLFCNPEDPESVANAVKELLGNDSLRNSIVMHARQLVKERYDWDIVAQQYYEIISHYSRI
jgi:glycosyltransferase involved in cell wall biosynthesis